MDCFERFLDKVNFRVGSLRFKLHLHHPVGRNGVDKYAGIGQRLPKKVFHLVSSPDRTNNLHSTSAWMEAFEAFPSSHDCEHLERRKDRHSSCKEFRSNAVKKYACRPCLFPLPPAVGAFFHVVLYGTTRGFFHCRVIDRRRTRKMGRQQQGSSFFVLACFLFFLQR